MIRKIVVSAMLAAIASGLPACSSSHSTSPQVAVLPNIAGAWEFKATSNTDTAHYTGIEVALKEGQTLVNGVEQANGQVSASGATQINVITVNATDGSVVFGANCAVSGSGTYSLAGVIASLGGPFNFTYTENGNVFNVVATLSGDGKTVTGTYSSATGSNCTDNGIINGNAVSKVSGTYVGQLTLPDGTSDSVTATLSEDSKSVLTVSLIASGADNTSLTMTGPTTGNTFLVQGTFQGQPVAYAGYLEQAIDPVSLLEVPAVYFVNATNAAQPAYAGTLIPPTT